ncbi:MAG TPA: glycosyltransferase [Steroidobacteraceae bacterium]|nr:glycosyltransferase [Steroidobacteraceae bacterium]
MGIVVGIDASRNRSGGAKAHLAGILGAGNPAEHGVSAVHVWSYRGLLDALPDAPWLTKHNPPELEGSLLTEALWQLHSMPGEVRRQRCDILLSPDAGTIGSFRPSVVMSRDMLSYEPGEMERYGLSKARLRLQLLRYIQARSLRRADGVIFLTQHAAQVIQGVTGRLPRVAVIPHGVGETFRRAGSHSSWPANGERDIRCVYVSNAELYKHQWFVVEAIGELRRRGYRVRLTLAGGGAGAARRRLDEQIRLTDPQGTFVTSIGAVRHSEVPDVLAAADLFIFASSCENMPNTLVEAMASGLPIACSDRGPMPEVLQEGGVYFDPEDSGSIATAIEKIIADNALRVVIAQRAQARSAQYSWTRCARETWRFLRESAGALV